ncbi:MAG: hypothetical protein HY924_05095 [Elusimicrobia bacterium]|nr:hypothetical protein [Elusimicrobiota bacterium]
MSQTPDIKPELNKAQQEPQEKKRGGFFANLLSKTPGSNSLAMGGVLATKAGIVGLAIIGTTVAGGIGYVGYKAMSPSSEPQNVSLFEARPKSALPADGTEAEKSGKDGVSGSLDMFVQANNPDGTNAPATAASADAAAGADAAASNKAVDHGNSTLSGPSASIPKPQFSGKIGQLSGSSGGSGSSAGISAGAAGGTQFAAGKRGNISAMGKANSRPTSVGGALKGLRRGSTMRTLGQIKKDNKGARSSAQGGRTYDGNNQAPGAFGAEAGVPEGGASSGEAGAGDLSGQPSTAINEKAEEEPPPTPPAKDVTPWSKELNNAKMLLMGAMAILFLAATMEQGGKYYSKGLVMALAIIGACLALAAMVIGFQVLGGKFGQKALGSIIALSGGLLVTTAIGLMTTTPDAGKSILATSGFSTLFLICGALGVVGAISTQFLKPKEINCKDCNDDKSCKKYCKVLIVPGGAPSDRAMERFTV